MASDNLKQLGKTLRKTRVDIAHTKNYISKQHPLVEEVADVFGSINTFVFEFETYGSESATLNLIIKPKFKTL